ncbi:hypothetical protein FHW88_003367 [Mucilaginibacter sp. SG538B]|uniref:hypothetical protein n=1 Tax=Mucilaginibacter sp. SG538B TaxID=2587021 RepID=UPI00159E2646|nr:hypothetical protein [Mucilaginibacter sp. SG538B]NVM65063.1 hypothetical protein [Mucilaginibacter sp. SG538B]
MDKSIERLIKQIQDLSEIVNRFNSEAVQIRIVEFLLPFVELKSKPIKNTAEQLAPIVSKEEYSKQSFKRPGVKRVLDQVMLTDFFDTEKNIAEIVKHLNDAGNDFKAPEVSGILLALTKDGRLKRYNSQVNNRFLYIRA